jgi:hypothetical protein
MLTHIKPGGRLLRHPHASVYGLAGATDPGLILVKYRRPARSNY